MMNSAARYACDLERAEVLLDPTLVPLLLRIPSHTKNPLDKPGTVCFVCLDHPRGGQYAVQVQCLRSKRGREISKGRIEIADVESPSDAPSHFKQSPEVEMRKKPPIYESLQPWDTVFEDDRAVYTRMLNVCFHYMGKWRKWLPFYGVVSVTEVMFQFDGRVSRDSRFSGLMTSVDIEKTKKDCQQAIELEPIPGSHNGWDFCGSDYHAKDCYNAMVDWDQECLTESAEKARERLRRIPLHYLFTTCARNPADANGLDTLSGMTQDSCIYPTFGDDRVEVPSMNEVWNGRVPIRALHFVFGWQMDRIKLELPYLVSVGFFGVSIIWLSVLLSRGSGFDWSSALAIGQVVAASVSILATSLCY